MRGRAGIATYLAAALVAAGFAGMMLGWYGAARLGSLPGQFPYLVSGGMGGLALVLCGAVILLLQTVRRESARQRAQLAHLQEALRVALGRQNERDR